MDPIGENSFPAFLDIHEELTKVVGALELIARRLERE